MDQKDILTLLIAVYAAGLSTYLGIRELNKERRSILIFLKFVAFYETYEISITNTGHRPIFINGISIDIPGSGLVPQGIIRQENEQLSFPFSLSDGENVNIRVGMTVSEFIRNAEENIHISVYDSEGKEYNKYRKIVFDAKWGGYQRR